MIHEWLCKTQIPNGLEVADASQGLIRVYEENPTYFVSELLNIFTDPSSDPVAKKVGLVILQGEVAKSKIPAELLKSIFDVSLNFLIETDEEVSFHAAQLLGAVAAGASYYGNKEEILEPIISHFSASMDSSSLESFMLVLKRFAESSSIPPKFLRIIIDTVQSKLSSVENKALVINLFGEILPDILGASFGDDVLQTFFQLVFDCSFDKDSRIPCLKFWDKLLKESLGMFREVLPTVVVCFVQYLRSHDLDTCEVTCRLIRHVLKSHALIFTPDMFDEIIDPLMEVYKVGHEMGLNTLIRLCYALPVHSTNHFLAVAEKNASAQDIEGLQLFLLSAICILINREFPNNDFLMEKIEFAVSFPVPDLWVLAYEALGRVMVRSSIWQHKLLELGNEDEVITEIKINTLCQLLEVPGFQAKDFLLSMLNAVCSSQETISEKAIDAIERVLSSDLEIGFDFAAEYLMMVIDLIDNCINKEILERLCGIAADLINMAQIELNGNVTAVLEFFLSKPRPCYLSPLHAVLLQFGFVIREFYQNIIEFVFGFLEDDPTIETVRWSTMVLDTLEQDIVGFGKFARQTICKLIEVYPTSSPGNIVQLVGNIVFDYRELTKKLQKAVLKFIQKETLFDDNEYLNGAITLMSVVIDTCRAEIKPPFFHSLLSALERAETSAVKDSAQVFFESISSGMSQEILETHPGLNRFLVREEEEEDMNTND